MSNLARVSSTMTPQEYFAFEEKTPLKHEYLAGVVYAMVDATDRHNMIALNIAALLHAARPTGCQVFVSDMKLKVQLMAGETYYYPDVLVSCAASDREPLFREQPILLVEVASPSTERIDHGEKLNAYRQIPALSEYVIVAQDQPEIEIYRRRNGWVREILRPDEALVLEGIGITLSPSQVYRDIDF